MKRAGWAEQVESEEMTEALITQGEGFVGNYFILRGLGSHGGLLARMGSEMNAFKLDMSTLAS